MPDIEDDTPLWKPGPFIVATDGGIKETHGFIFAGLGMWKVIEASPKGKRPPTWSLTHLGTGHRVMLINAHILLAFDIATGVAGLSDWTFEGLVGFENTDPELPRKVRDFADVHRKTVKLSLGGNPSEEDAMRVAYARA